MIPIATLCAVLLILSAVAPRAGRFLVVIAGGAFLAACGGALAQEATGEPVLPGVSLELGEGPVSAALLALGYFLRDGLLRAVSVLERALELAKAALPVVERGVEAAEKLVK
jgi:hypothetical protein